MAKAQISIAPCETAEGEMVLIILRQCSVEPDETGELKPMICMSAEVALEFADKLCQAADMICRGNYAPPALESDDDSEDVN